MPKKNLDVQETIIIFTTVSFFIFMKSCYKNIKRMPIKFWLFIALCIFAIPLIIYATGTTEEGYECLPGTSRKA